MNYNDDYVRYLHQASKGLSKAADPKEPGFRTTCLGAWKKLGFISEDDYKKLEYLDNEAIRIDSRSPNFDSDDDLLSFYQLKIEAHDIWEALKSKLDSTKDYGSEDGGSPCYKGLLEVLRNRRKDRPQVELTIEAIKGIKEHTSGRLEEAKKEDVRTFDPMRIEIIKKSLEEKFRDPNILKKFMPGDINLIELAENVSSQAAVWEGIRDDFDKITSGDWSPVGHTAPIVHGPFSGGSTSIIEHQEVFANISKHQGAAKEAELRMPAQEALIRDIDDNSPVSSEEDWLNPDYDGDEKIIGSGAVELQICLDNGLLSTEDLFNLDILGGQVPANEADDMLSKLSRKQRIFHIKNELDPRTRLERMHKASNPEKYKDGYLNLNPCGMGLLGAVGAIGFINIESEFIKESDASRLILKTGRPLGHDPVIYEAQEPSLPSPAKADECGPDADPDQGEIETQNWPKIMEKIKNNPTCRKGYKIVFQTATGPDPSERMIFSWKNGGWYLPENFMTGMTFDQSLALLTYEDHSTKAIMEITEILRGMEEGEQRNIKNYSDKTLMDYFKGEEGGGIPFYRYGEDRYGYPPAGSFAGYEIEDIFRQVTRVTNSKKQHVLYTNDTLDHLFETHWYDPILRAIEPVAYVIIEATHIGLDLAGLIPGWGEIADLTNGVLYCIQKRFFEAAISFICIIPFIDIFVKGAKWFGKGVAATFRVLISDNWLRIKKLMFGGKASNGTTIPGILHHRAIAKYADDIWAALEAMRRGAMDGVPFGIYIKTCGRSAQEQLEALSEQVIGFNKNLTEEVIEGGFKQTGEGVFQEVVELVYKNGVDETAEILIKGGAKKGAKETSEEFIERVVKENGAKAGEIFIKDGEVVIRNAIPDVLLNPETVRTIVSRHVKDLTVSAMKGVKNTLEDSMEKTLYVLFKPENWKRLDISTRRLLADWNPANGWIQRSWKKKARGDLTFVMRGSRQIAEDVISVNSKGISEVLERYSRLNQIEIELLISKGVLKEGATAGFKSIDEVMELLGVQKLTKDSLETVLETGAKGADGTIEYGAKRMGYELLEDGSMRLFGNAVDNVPIELLVRQADNIGIDGMKQWLRQSTKMGPAGDEFIGESVGKASKEFFDPSNVSSGPLFDAVSAALKESGTTWDEFAERLLGKGMAGGGEDLAGKYLEDFVKRETKEMIEHALRIAKSKGSKGAEEEFVELMLKADKDLAKYFAKRSKKGVAIRTGLLAAELALKFVPYIILVTFIALSIYHRNAVREEWEKLHKAALGEGGNDPESVAIREALENLNLLNKAGESDTMSGLGRMIFRPNELRDIAVSNSIGCPKEMGDNGQVREFVMPNLQTLEYVRAFFGLIDTDYSVRRLFSPGGHGDKVGTDSPIDIPVGSGESIDPGSLVDWPINYPRGIGDWFEGAMLPESMKDAVITHPESMPSEDRFGDLSGQSEEEIKEEREEGVTIPTNVGELASHFSDAMIEEMLPAWTEEFALTVDGVDKILATSRTDAEATCNAENLKSILVLSYYLKSIGADTIHLEDDIQIVTSTALFIYAHRYSWLLKRLQSASIFSILKVKPGGLHNSTHLWDTFLAFKRMFITYSWIRHDVSMATSNINAAAVNTNNFGHVEQYVQEVAVSNIEFLKRYRDSIDHSFKHFAKEKEKIIQALLDPKTQEKAVNSICEKNPNYPGCD